MSLLLSERRITSPPRFFGADMDLLMLGAGMGIVGGLFPSPLHFIALAQAGLNRWSRAVFVLIGPPVAVDGVLLLVTFFFYQYIPQQIGHNVAYVGGAVSIAFGAYSLLKAREKKPEELARSSSMTYGSVTVAMLGEVTAPGTWVYWLTIAGPILSEGRTRGYWHIVPFFAGGLVGYYGAAVFSVWLLSLGAGLHPKLKRSLFAIANALLVGWGVFYILRAYLTR